MKEQFNYFVIIFCLIISVNANGQQLILHSQDTVAGTATDIWGYVDPVTGTEYALVGTFFNGISIFDLTDPSNPSLVTVTQGGGFDIKTYQNYLYSTSGEIFDITDIHNPIPVGNHTIGGHNLWVAEEEGLLITECSGMRIYDLTQDPTNPVELHYEELFGCHDAVTFGDTLIGFHGSTGTFMYDISTPDNPNLISAIYDNTISYSHQGWMTEDRRYLYIADELADPETADISIWDMADLDNPVRVGNIISESARVHNLYFVDDLMFVSYYLDGVKVFDISDPVNPVLVDAYDTSPNSSGNNFNGVFGVYPFLPSGLILASDMNLGLLVMELGTATTVEVVAAVTGIKAFPNPFSEGIRISFTLKAASEVELDIFSSLGARVYSERKVLFGGHNSIDISLPHIPSGVYHYNLRFNNEHTSGKFVKM